MIAVFLGGWAGGDRFPKEGDMPKRSTPDLTPFDAGIYALFGAVIALLVVFFARGGIALGWYVLPVIFAVAGYAGMALLHRYRRSRL
jgi:hypothetical protein